MNLPDNYDLIILDLIKVTDSQFDGCTCVKEFGMATLVAEEVQTAALHQNGAENPSAENVDMVAMGKAARLASRSLATLTTAQKNAALAAIAQELEAQADAIIAANAQDLADGRAKGLSDALLDRLMLNEKRVQALADDTLKIIDLPDPVGSEYESRVLAQRPAPKPPPHPHRRHWGHL